LDRKQGDAGEKDCLYFQFDVCFLLPSSVFYSFADSKQHTPDEEPSFHGSMPKCPTVNYIAIYINSPVSAVPIRQTYSGKSAAPHTCRND